MDKIKNILISEEIDETINKLYLRINDRFPRSGLSNVCLRLREISNETNQIVEWISRPNYIMRSFTYFIIIMLLITSVLSMAQLNFKLENLSIADFVQVMEAGLSGLVFIGAGVAFLITFENKRKRKRIINAINILKSLAHIVDMHQLTKDPHGQAKVSVPTEHSPKRNLNNYELGRYLDYCSEILSLISKLGFLYIQNFDDSIANNAVNELENLSSGLSRKIWQKVMILHYDE